MEKIIPALVGLAIKIFDRVEETRIKVYVSQVLFVSI